MDFEIEIAPIKTSDLQSMSIKTSELQPELQLPQHIRKSSERIRKKIEEKTLALSEIIQKETATNTPQLKRCQSVKEVQLLENRTPSNNLEYQSIASNSTPGYKKPLTNSQINEILQNIGVNESIENIVAMEPNVFMEYLKSGGFDKGQVELVRKLRQRGTPSVLLRKSLLSRLAFTLF